MNLNLYEELVRRNDKSTLEVVGNEFARIPTNKVNIFKEKSEHGAKKVTNGQNMEIEEYSTSNPKETNIFQDAKTPEDKEIENNGLRLKPMNYLLHDTKVVKQQPVHKLEINHQFKESLIDFAAGTLGGAAQTFASQPFDTVKVKLQTFPKLYNGMFKCLLRSYRNDGVIRGLYAGTIPAIFANVAENSILFTAYGGCQKFLTFIMKVDRVEELSVFGNACAGFLAAFFSSFTLCPAELIKCKLQAVREMKQFVAKDTKVMPTSTFQITRDICVNEGIAGFYRGLTPTLVREMPGFFFFFGGYEATRKFFTEPGQSKDDIGPLKTMCAGAVGGIALWTSTYPADVIKSRIQINNLNGSMLSVGINILQKEGVFAFYNGLAPTILRTIPATATLFLVYEYYKKILTNKFNAN